MSLLRSNLHRSLLLAICLALAWSRLLVPLRTRIWGLDSSSNVFLEFSRPVNRLQELIVETREPTPMAVNKPLENLRGLLLSEDYHLSPSQRTILEALDTPTTRALYFVYGPSPILHCSWCNATTKIMTGTASDFMLYVWAGYLAHYNALALGLFLLTAQTRMHKRALLFTFVAIAFIVDCAMLYMEDTKISGMPDRVPPKYVMFHSQWLLYRAYFTTFMLLWAFLVKPVYDLQYAQAEKLSEIYSALEAAKPQQEETLRQLDGIAGLTKQSEEILQGILLDKNLRERYVRVYEEREAANVTQASYVAHSLERDVDFREQSACFESSIRQCLGLPSDRTPTVRKDPSSADSITTIKKEIIDSDIIKAESISGDVKIEETDDLSLFDTKSDSADDGWSQVVKVEKQNMNPLSPDSKKKKKKKKKSKVKNE